MISRRTVVCLGSSQLICWGVTYYLVGVFGESIAEELGWGRDLIYGGFALGLLVMGLVSPATGRLIDRHGGRNVMAAGSALNAIGCTVLGLCHSHATYVFAWLCLGLGMRMTLYDAAFATLARIGGPHARRPISQITLFGGLASTAFWPIGQFLSEHMGWRHALFIYAGFALLTLPLHLAIPRHRHEEPVQPQAPEYPPLSGGTTVSLKLVGVVYAAVVALTNFLNAGMSAHMIAMLGGLGLAVTVSVRVSALRGIGQTSARLCEILFGRNVHPVALNMFAALLLPLSFVTVLLCGVSIPAAVTFAFLYGACNGLLTIARGTLPLVFFDHRTYGSLVGRLIAPSFILAAASPVIYSTVIDRFGWAAGLDLSAVCAALILCGSVLLVWFSRRNRAIQVSDGPSEVRPHP